MKRIVAVLSLFLMLQSMQAQRKKFDHILTTTDIALIEDFLRTAHPEDPRRIVLKPRLRSLKNMAWTKSGTMNYAAVSYTHLDVYKRQIFYSSFIHPIILISMLRKTTMKPFPSISKSICPFTKSVSEIHI